MKIIRTRFGKHVTKQTLYDQAATIFGWHRQDNKQYVSAGIRIEISREKSGYPHYFTETTTLNIDVEFSEVEIKRLYAQLKEVK